MGQCLNWPVEHTDTPGSTLFVLSTEVHSQVLHANCYFCQNVTSKTFRSGMWAVCLFFFCCCRVNCFIYLLPFLNTPWQRTFNLWLFVSFLSSGANTVEANSQYAPYSWSLALITFGRMQIESYTKRKHLCLWLNLIINCMPFTDLSLFKRVLMKCTVSEVTVAYLHYFHSRCFASFLFPCRITKFKIWILRLISQHQQILVLFFLFLLSLFWDYEITTSLYR